MTLRRVEIRWDAERGSGQLWVWVEPVDAAGRWEPMVAALTLRELVRAAELVLEGNAATSPDWPRGVRYVAGLHVDEVARRVAAIEERLDALAGSDSLRSHVGVIEQRIVRIGERLAALEGAPKLAEPAP